MARGWQPWLSADLTVPCFCPVQRPSTLRFLAWTIQLPHCSWDTAPGTLNPAS